MATVQNNRILIVDDNPAIHEDLRKILMPPARRDSGFSKVKAALFNEESEMAVRMEFRIDSAFQGEEGLEMVLEALSEEAPYSVAFVDVRMPPGWDGVETVRRLWEAYPDLQVVICTAYSDYPWDDMSARLGKSANMVLLKKPFDNVEVLQLAHAMTEKWQLNRQVLLQIRELDDRVNQRTKELASANERLMREIAEREQVEQVLRQAQKMEAVGQLAAGIAHDFNNILTVILGNLSLLGDSTGSDDAKIPLREIRNSAERGGSLVRQLLAFSRKQIIRPLPMIVGDTLTSLGEVLRRVLGERVNLQVRVGENLPLIVADLCMIEQVIINLAVNSRDAMPGGGDLTISADAVEISEEDVERESDARVGSFVRLTVTDTGFGIPPELLPRVFEPFFTTKATGTGTGLGLSSVYGILKQHEGWVEVESELGVGTTFRLFWPASLNEEDRSRQLSGANPASGGNETILVVEDEAPVRKLISSVLRRNGYTVLEAASGQEAISVFQQHKNEIQLMLSDMVLPGAFSGQELRGLFLKSHPGLPVAFMTGYNAAIAGKGAGREEAFHLLVKPFSTSDLLRTVRLCLDGGAPQDNQEAVALH